MQRLRLGELLVQAKILTNEQLEESLAMQRAQGRKLGQVLIDRGLVNETQLTQALGQQLSVPWVSLYHIDFSRQLLNLVPREIADLYCLVPIFVRRVRKQGETLYVAMDDPTHEAALEAVRQSSSLPVRPMIAAPSDIRSAIRAYYGGDEADIAAVSSTMTPLSNGPTTIQGVAPVGPPPPPPRQAPPPPPPARARPAEPESAPEPAAASQPDSPDAWPEVEARTLDLPKRKGGPRMVALTLLDGSTIQLPAKPRRGRRAEAEPAEAGEAPDSGKLPADMTARDLIHALRAVSDGADTQAVFGERVPIESICAAILSLLLKKGLLADWEFVEELRKR